MQLYPPKKVHVRRIRSQVVVALKQACDQAGFNIPYPIRTLDLPNLQNSSSVSVQSSSR